MEEAEAHARSNGVDMIHLSTHDKQSFYSHLGYVTGPVVSPQRSCVARLGDKVCEQVPVVCSTRKMVPIKRASSFPIISHPA